jgi:predicted AAA+ superfamily ATPase
MYINRNITAKLQALLAAYPVVTITGPRQSGKSTLLRHELPGYSYVSLETPDTLLFARSDPRAFLAALGDRAIIDEAQKLPELFSYIQTIVDSKQQNGAYVLSGSANFLLMQSISQSLAGRVGILTLLPLARTEHLASDLDKLIFSGSYPRIYDQHIDPSDYYQNYIQTYVERDVRMIKNITDLSAFTNFLRVCAARIGSLLNIADISTVCGISVPTARSWLSVLESSYVMFRLQPYYNNYDKRIRKTPKLYFYDTGLACSLLRITDATAIATHPMRGHLFENLVITELCKSRYNNGIIPDFYFWRQSETREIDLLITEKRTKAIEIKASQTFRSEFAKQLDYFSALANDPNLECFIVYAGELTGKMADASYVNWQNLEQI